MDEIKQAFIKNIAKLHTTPLGKQRVKRNLGLSTDDVVSWCKKQIFCSIITKHGKNYYIKTHDSIITVNSTSFTIITAHKQKNIDN